MSIIVIGNHKGGVSKSTLTFNLAKTLASDGYKVLAVDNDPQGDLTCSLLGDIDALKSNVIGFYHQKDIEPQEVCKNLDLIGACLGRGTNYEITGYEKLFSLREGLKPFKEIYDYILIDTHPSSGLMTGSAITSADFVLVPTKAHPYDVSSTKEFLRILEENKKHLNSSLELLGIVITAKEGRSNKVEKQYTKNLQESFPEILFEHYLPKSTMFPAGASICESIIDYAPKTDIAKRFKLLYEEFLKRMKKIEKSKQR